MSRTSLCLVEGAGTSNGYSDRTPIAGYTRVRKSLSRSSSECELHHRVRRKACVMTMHDCAKEEAPLSSVQLPPGLLSCLSMLELSKLDTSANLASQQLPTARRPPSRCGSLSERVSSSSSMIDILSRIRVPSQRAAMAEMAAAAERIEMSHAAGRSRPPSLGRMATMDAPLFELESEELVDVLEREAPPSQAAGPPLITSAAPPPAASPVVAWQISAAPCDAQDSSHHTTPPTPPAPPALPALGHCGHAAAAAAHGPHWAAGPSTAGRFESAIRAGQAFMPSAASALAAVSALGRGALSWGSRPPSVGGTHAVDVAAAPTAAPDTAAAAATAPAAASMGLPELAGSVGIPLCVGLLNASVVPTVFQWVQPASTVFLCGSFNMWEERIPMQRRAGRDEWWIVLNLLPGEYAYKFVVQTREGNTEWRHAAEQPTLVDASGQSNNWLSVIDQNTYETDPVRTPRPLMLA